MPKKVEKKIIRETKIPVRIVKTAKSSKEIEKPTLVPQKPTYVPEEKRKGLLIVVSIVVIMLIIFSIWVSYLKYNMKKTEQEGQSLWGTIKNNLTSGLSGADKVWQRITNIFSSNTNQTEEQQLENNVFPEIKSNTNQ